MNDASESTPGSRELRLAWLVDELRADAANALHYSTDDDGDVAAFTRLRELAARLMAEVDVRDEADIVRDFARDGLRTPLVGVVLILNDQRHGILLATEPGGRAHAPHGFVDRSQDPESAARGLIRRLLPDEEALPVPHGICDSISAGVPQPHTYYLTYVADVTFVDRASFAVDLVSLDQVDPAAMDPLTRYIVEGAERTVIDAPLALPTAVRELLAEIAELADTGVRETADAYNKARFLRMRDTMEAVLDGVGNESPLARYDFGPLDAATPIAAGEALIVDDRHRVLLMRRADNGQWAMPGGACEVGETSAATAVREAAEELDVEIEIDGLAGVYDSRQVSDADIGPWILFVYVARLADASQRPKVTPEASDFGWYELDQLSGLDMFAGHRVEIERAFKVMSG